jgi:hypothetical protein
MTTEINPLLERAKTYLKDRPSLLAIVEKYEDALKLQKDVEGYVQKVTRSLELVVTHLEDEARRYGEKRKNVFSSGIPDGVSRYSIGGYHLGDRSGTIVQVIEVTGFYRGARVAPKCFNKAELKKAQKYLKTLDQGNAWLSEAMIQDAIIYTVSRKRINLHHPDCLC